MSEQPASPPPHFIVFVPGYMGSKLRDKRTGEIVWIDLQSILRDPFHLRRNIENLFATMTYPNDNLEPAGIVDQVVFVPPLFKQEQYGRMLDALKAMGYAIDPQDPSPNTPSAYTFSYDWRQDNRISARQLGEAILGWEKHHPGAQAWIIGHSNGGIVARWYIEKEGGKDHTGRLFLMGSPWDGAPKSVMVMQRGLQVMFLRLLNIVDVSRLSQDLIRSFPSFYQLIPYTNPFLRDVNNNPVNLFADLNWLDNDRQSAMLLDALKFNQDLGKTLSVETLCFFGSKKPTTTAGLVRYQAGGKWSGVDWDQTEAGDGTVPERSAVHPNASQKLPFVVSHGDIYVNPAVLEKLEWELVRKYRGGVLAEVITKRFKIQFEPEKDVYAPGETVGMWATVREIKGKKTPPVFGASIHVELQLRELLPYVAAPEAPPQLPAIDLQPAAGTPGRYEGSLSAPDLPGYYKLSATVTIGDEQPIPIEELILVEAEPDLAALERDQPREASAEPPDGIPNPGPTGGEAPPANGWGEKPKDAWAMPDEEKPGDDALESNLGWGEGKKDAWDTSFALPDDEELPKSPPLPEDQVAQRFLNARFEDHDESQALSLGEEYTLVVSVGIEAEGESDAFDPQNRVFSEQEDLVELTIHLTSKDFSILTPEPQHLRVPRSGPSKNKARFDLEPKHAGEGELNVLVYKSNNFVQGMVLKVNVAAQGETLEKGVFSGHDRLGRPVEGSFAMQRRDVSLLIKKSTGGFDLTLVGAVAAEAFLPLTPEQLNQMVAATRKELLEIVYLWSDGEDVYVLPPDTRQVPPNVDLVYQTGIDIPDNISHEALKRLAKAGFLLYKRIFYAKNARQDSIRMGDRLRELANKEDLKIQIVSQEFMLPWALLYLADKFDEDHVDPEWFLGLKHIIEHIPLQQDMAALDSQIKSSPVLNVSLNINEDIDAEMGITVVQDQVAYWEKARQSGCVNLIERRKAPELVKALGDSTTPDQILYFYGHAVSQQLADEGGPGGSFLALSGGSQVSLDDLDTLELAPAPLAGAPLVFINACESAELSPLFYDGFMPYFTAKGARGMIGTECRIPSRFAAEWASRFFDRFLGGQRSLGEVFLDLRREFFYQHNNILGMLYALYCDGDTKVTPGLTLD